MIDIKSAFSVIYRLVEPFAKENEFEVVKVTGLAKDAVPVLKDGDTKHVMQYVGQGKKFIVVFDEKAKTMTFFMGASDDERANCSQVAVWSFDLETCDERDAKSVGNDFLETMKQNAKVDVEKIKLPQTVSKSAAKKGELTFDSKTLATRFCTLFPELKVALKQNIAKYGDVMPETFFQEHAISKVFETIDQGDKGVIKKMFNLFNEIYDDGNNDVQGIIVVTIFGQIKNENYFKIVEEYASELLNEHIVEVNRLLSSAAGKKYLKKLKNPPAYKAKKSFNFQPQNLTEK